MQPRESTHPQLTAIRLVGSPGWLQFGWRSRRAKRVKGTRSQTAAGRLTCPESTRYAGRVGTSQVTITLNGEPFELDQPLSVTDLLAKLEIDPRRVAIEHNLTILKRHTFTTVVIGEGDRLEIVNAVGGG